MPAERTTMRHMREELRLKFVGGVTTREIARRIGAAPVNDPHDNPTLRGCRASASTSLCLWDEYIARDPEGYRYSRFCELYRSWEGKLSVRMRQTHLGGDKLFVDYAGDTVPVIIDRLTGEVRQAQIFVA